MVYEIEECINRDLQHIWHPCMQMKDFELSPPLVIKHAKGSYIYTNQGPLIDSMSSWWCKSLGHGHPRIKQAIIDQLQHFEHVIAANTTHPSLVKLAETLARLSKKQHLFLASDGSSAVEIALKLTLHAAQIKGHTEKTQFISLKNGYHGETFATMSISDLALYKKPYQSNLTVHPTIQNIPYVTGQEDPLWLNADTYWSKAKIFLESIKSTCCAIIIEPLVQGAGGMRCYSADFLQKLAQWAKKNNIYLIADEIMTGLLRTGEWFAYQHAGIEPDLICLSKGLTSGSIPCSSVLIDHAIYQLFYDDYEKENSFLHSHTFSGNALAVRAALATLEVMLEENIKEQSQRLAKKMEQYFTEILRLSDKLVNYRHLGAIVAADLVDSPKRKRLGFDFYQEALKHGALIRPLGKTVYWLPPLNTDENTIVNLAEITLKSINALY